MKLERVKKINSMVKIIISNKSMILSNEMLMQLNIELWKYMSNEKS